MRLNLSLTHLLLITLAVCHAVPAPKTVEKKSLKATEAKINEKNLKIEETGDEKDRSKKSTTTFCVEIRPGSSQPTPCACKDNPNGPQNQNVVDQHSQHHSHQQTPQIVPLPAPTEFVQPVPHFQNIETVNVVDQHSQHHSHQQTPQIVPLPAPTEFVQPVPHSQNIQTVNVAPSSQQSQTTNIIQPAVQPGPHYPIEVKPSSEQNSVSPSHSVHPFIIENHPLPLPVPHESIHQAQIVQPVPESHVIHAESVPVETVNILPVSPGCSDNQMVVVPSRPVFLLPEIGEGNQMIQPTVIQIPGQISGQIPAHQIQIPTHHRPGHGIECSCVHHRSAEAIRNGDFRERTWSPYGRTISKVDHHTFAGVQKSPLMVQCDPKIVHLGDGSTPMLINGQVYRADMGNIMDAEQMQGRTGTIISVHSGSQPQTVYHKLYQPGYHGAATNYNPYTLPTSSVMPQIAINSYPAPGGMFYRDSESRSNEAVNGLNNGNQGMNFRTEMHGPMEAHDHLQPAAPSQKVPREVDARIEREEISESGSFVGESEKAAKPVERKE